MNSEMNNIQKQLRTNIKEDEFYTNKLLRSCFSASANEPINIMSLANTSEGKTYGAIQVTKLFPKNDVIVIGKMSPTALIHQKGILEDENGKPLQPQLNELKEKITNKKELKKQQAILLSKARMVVSLENKTLLFVESPDIRLWNMLKPILSHDKREIEYKTTLGDGSLRVKNTIIRGWPAVIVCSARNEAKFSGWDEMENRFDIVSPNTSITKYKAANKYSVMKSSIPDFAKNMYTDSELEQIAKRNAQKISLHIKKLCKNGKNPIWNPFYIIIGENLPHNEGVWMRYTKRFMSYLNVETLINSKERCKIQFKNNSSNKIDEYLITNLEDIQNTIKLVGDISPVPPQKRRFIEDIFEPTAIELPVGTPPTSAKLAEKYEEVYGIKTTPKKILENFLKPLCDLGVLNSWKNEDNKREKFYEIISDPSVNSLDFLTKEIIEQSNIDDSFVDSGLKQLQEHSKDKGEFVILDPQRNQIDISNLKKHLFNLEDKSNVNLISQA